MDQQRRTLIPLSEKLIPTPEVDATTRSTFGPTAVSYGPVDATKLLDRLQSESPAIWTTEGQKTNVRVFRPFHDDLGVGQIIFTFCDDLLETVYRFPWWHSWKNEIEDVFDQLQINKKKVIRCLLAKLPPKTVIPVHHDTGLWATKSHRVHVPLITSAQSIDDPEKYSSELVFKSGMVDEQMERIAFSKFEVVELNNRSKHFVENNWDRDRVHLIFDYVEEDEEIVVQDLKLDDLVEQTRRMIYIRKNKEEFKYSAEDQSEALPNEERKRLFSVLLNFIMISKNFDRFDEFKATSRRFTTGEISTKDYFNVLRSLMKEAHLRISLNFILPKLVADKERMDSLLSSCAAAGFSLELKWPKQPRFLLLGAMKCATTSLYEYICQHNEIQRAQIKESHFFDWRWEEMNKLKLGSNSLKLLNGHASSFDSDLKQKYALLFSNAIKNEKISGEATPSYLLGGSTVAKRVLKVFDSGTKFIVILRDPVSRAFSHFQMTNDPNGTKKQKQNRGFVEGKSFEQLVEEDLSKLKALNVSCGMDVNVFDKEYLSKTLLNSHGSHSYIGRGLYSLQIKAWLSVFPREFFHFLLLDDLKNESEFDSEMRQIFEFIDVEETEQKIIDKSIRNGRKYEKIDEAVEKKLKEFYKPFNKDLENLIGKDLSSWN